MDQNNIVFQIAVWLVPLVIAIVFHEVAHGLVARRLGDPTAEERGRLSLNPIRHIDPFGTVILPLILAVSHAGAIFGWAKPVPVNYARLRNPRRDMVLVALAGMLPFCSSSEDDNCIAGQQIACACPGSVLQ